MFLHYYISSCYSGRGTGVIACGVIAGVIPKPGSAGGADGCASCGPMAMMNENKIMLIFRNIKQHIINIHFCPLFVKPFC